jgi:hypothetical protein
LYSSLSWSSTFSATSMSSELVNAWIGFWIAVHNRHTRLQAQFEIAKHAAEQGIESAEAKVSAAQHEADAQIASAQQVESSSDVSSTQLLKCAIS